MAVTDKGARRTLAAACLALALACGLYDLPAASGRQFWSDASTYYAMTWSLVSDGDLRYEARDLLRVRRHFGADPQGLFLKRVPDQRPGRDPGLAWRWAPDLGFPWIHRLDEPRIHYAKSFAHPLATAPFVMLLGDRGFLVANAAFLSVALWCAFLELRRRGSEPGPALAVTLALLGLSVTPIYLLWMTPEILNVGVLAAALFAWSRDRPLLSAALFGFACFSKPYNAFVAAPLGFAPLLPLLAAGFGRRFLESCRRGAVMIGVMVGLFGLNAVFTGEMNYQGGERKTFYGQFPEDLGPGGKQITFGNSGQWMTTDYLGPLVEGRDEDKQTKGTGPLRDPAEIRASFWLNLGHFWWGRFGGVLPYYPAAALAVLVYLLAGPRDRDGALALSGITISWIFYIVQIPDNWYGGGGTVGNRYFLNVLPLLPYVVPPARALLVAVPGALLGLAFLAPTLWAPLQASMKPGQHAGRVPFVYLPAELAMLNDLSAFVEPWRKKRSVGDTEGDAHRGWPADPRAYYLYFPDDGTTGVVTEGGVQGLRLKPGARAEILLRALEPVAAMTVTAVGDAPGTLDVRSGAGAARLALERGQPVQAPLPPGERFAYYATSVYVLTFESDGPGAFVSIALEPRPR